MYYIHVEYLLNINHIILMSCQVHNVHKCFSSKGLIQLWNVGQLMVDSARWGIYFVFYCRLVSNICTIQNVFYFSDVGFLLKPNENVLLTFILYIYFFRIPWNLNLRNRYSPPAGSIIIIFFSPLVQGQNQHCRLALHTTMVLYGTSAGAHPGHGSPPLPR